MTLDDEIACIEREIAMRQSVYPRWIELNEMAEAKARHELNAMQAVLSRLLAIRAAQTAEREQAEAIISGNKP